MIFHGAKAYGAHLGPFPTPARESAQAVPGPLLYRDQEQVLREYGQRLGFTWTVLRSDCICGPALGSPINLLLGVAVLAAAGDAGVDARAPGIVRLRRRVLSRGPRQAADRAALSEFVLTAVRWITRQPASFTGHVLTFQRLRELGALPAHDTGGVR